ncbi:telomere repeat-binding protein 5 isoform X2 [Ricinus communis]|uniref:telomere repeat-binding protein 5 isoform X2 n=1 Tax=Ricinus communis TaxID=3988 RepID=UPI00201AF9F1|nr:telomere repeat-binding protein 5 isoform X2 [Ricinus communis]
MVLQKRLDYGFNGYQVPPTPRATRSRRGSFKKKVEESQTCAFDLLAIVAGNLLHDKESTPGSSNTSADKNQCVAVNDTVKNKWQNDEKNMKVETQDQGSPARKFFISELVAQDNEQNHCSDDLNLGVASALATSDCAERFDAEKLVNGKGKNDMGSFASKVEVGSSRHREFDGCKLEGETKKIIKDEPQKFGKVINGTVADMCSFDDPLVWDGKPHAHVSSDSSAKTSLCGNHVSHGSYPANWDDLIVDRDDDENSSGCTHPSTTKKFLRPAPRIGDRRIRKVLASKYWKVAPRMKDGTLSNTVEFLWVHAGGDSKPFYHKRKNYYKYQRSERLYPFKKRKHFGYGSQSNFEGAISREFISDSPKKGSIGDAAVSSPKMHGATAASSSIAGQRNSFQSRDSHVKLRIKSFRVPELFIEIPESATVGLLKRTVMDAVIAILGGGLRVGVLLQGKKVRDDNKTLMQTGIAHNNQLDALGFSLEPNPSQTPHSLSPGSSSFLPSCDTPQPLSRYPPDPSLVHQATCGGSPEPHSANLGNFIESDHDSAPFPKDMLVDKSTSDSKALVPLSEMNMEALAVVPAHRKSKRSEIVQRRIRRPFSVTEVEALVQAVEKLGTGRWRDVKLRAFDNAKHRTYVDLKDKWKTLVHTARISPQQRRGEPVPQELLDRVLTAHAYWSQQQAKQQLKQQQPETCLLL